MTQLLVTNRAGEERAVDAQGGQSLMQALRALGFDDILAICGVCVRAQLATSTLIPHIWIASHLWEKTKRHYSKAPSTARRSRASPARFLPTTFHPV